MPMVGQGTCKECWYPFPLSNFERHVVIYGELTEAGRLDSFLEWETLLDEPTCQPDSGSRIIGLAHR